MANKAMPIVPIELDKPRRLKLGMRAVMAFEEKTGKNLMRENVWENMNASMLVTIIWACLLHEDKALTVDQVADMVGLDDIGYLTDKALETWGIAAPKKREGDGATDPLAQEPSPPSSTG